MLVADPPDRPRRLRRSWVRRSGRPTPDTLRRRFLGGPPRLTPARYSRTRPHSERRAAVRRSSRGTRRPAAGPRSAATSRCRRASRRSPYGRSGVGGRSGWRRFPSSCWPRPPSPGVSTSSSVCLLGREPPGGRAARPHGPQPTADQAGHRRARGHVGQATKCAGRGATPAGPPGDRPRRPVTRSCRDSSGDQLAAQTLGEPVELPARVHGPPTGSVAGAGEPGRAAR